MLEPPGKQSRSWLNAPPLPAGSLDQPREKKKRANEELEARATQIAEYWFDIRRGALLYLKEMQKNPGTISREQSDLWTDLPGLSGRMGFLLEMMRYLFETCRLQDYVSLEKINMELEDLERHHADGTDTKLCLEMLQKNQEDLVIDFEIGD